MTDTVYDGDTGSSTEYAFTAEGVSLTVMCGRTPLFAPLQKAPGIGAHTHSWYEVFFVSGGHLLFFCGGERLSLSEGEILLVAPGTVHYTESAADGAERYVFNFSYRVQKEGPASHALGGLFDFSSFRRIRAGAETRRDVERLFAALRDGDGLLAGNRFFGLLLTLAQTVRTGKMPVEDLLSDSGIGRIYKLEQLFDAYYMCNLPLSTLATELHLSARQLARIIKRQYGCTYLEKMTSMRMAAAARLLGGGDRSVTQIAADVGYASPSCFYAAFRKTYGCLPLDYRRLHKTESEDPDHRQDAEQENTDER